PRGYRPALDGRFVNTGLPFLVRDCRWSRAYSQTIYLVLLLNFLHETGCDGTGCGVGVRANDVALEFVSALGRGHAGQDDREALPRPTGAYTGAGRSGRAKAGTWSCVRILGRSGSPIVRNGD